MLIACARPPALHGATPANKRLSGSRSRGGRLINGNVAFLDSLYAKEFRVQGTNGKVISRADDIAGFASGDIRPELITAEEMQVAIYGDVAVVTGLDHLKGNYKGHVGEGRVRFMDVIVHRDGRWQLVAIQGTWANNP